ncbi:hypothetical protein [Halostreptopolyspora alba]|uniref:hypothetical protein n=1 Tax=Halostreptopolyspora alba TaxID=2487137 RepID=UPI0037137194
MDARTMRRRLTAAAQQLGITTEPTYDRSEGWSWEWSDGPTVEVVAAALGAEVADRVRLHRRPSPRAAALAVILEALHGTDAGTHLETSPDPTAAPDARTDALATALAETAPLHMADDPMLLRRHLHETGGPAALLHPYTGTHDADPADPLAMTAIEHLTQHYIQPGDAEAREAWTHHLRTAPDAPALARAALADTEADRPTRLAAVAMLGALRAELEALEDAAMTAAVEAGASYTALGRAMGVARQVAHRRHSRRAAGHPARLSPQRRQQEDTPEEEPEDTTETTPEAPEAAVLADAQAVLAEPLASRVAQVLQARPQPATLGQGRTHQVLHHLASAIRARNHHTVRSAVEAAAALRTRQRPISAHPDLVTALDALHAEVSPQE